MRRTTPIDRKWHMHWWDFILLFCFSFFASSRMTIFSLGLLGDSGSGVMWQDDRSASTNTHNRWFLRGTLSFGPAKCGKIGFPVVYTRVEKYLDWIQGQKV